MEDKKFLNEETYQKNRKKIIKVSLIVLIIGILIGCSLVVIGIISQRRVNSKYSDENKQKLQEKIAIEKKNLEIKKSELIKAQNHRSFFHIMMLELNVIAWNTILNVFLLLKIQE